MLDPLFSEVRGERLAVQLFISQSARPHLFPSQRLFWSSAAQRPHSFADADSLHLLRGCCWRCETTQYKVKLSTEACVRPHMSFNQHYPRARAFNLV